MGLHAYNKVIDKCVIQKVRPNLTKGYTQTLYLSRLRLKQGIEIHDSNILRHGVPEGRSNDGYIVFLFLFLSIVCVYTFFAAFCTAYLTLDLAKDHAP